MSPPKKPIVFWLEKTIPYKYRKPIRDGILEWNKAFEKAGFVNAIEVRATARQRRLGSGRHQLQHVPLDHHEHRSGMVMAMGPSRVNPTNGQILNAMIIFDADFLQSWKPHYETFTPGQYCRVDRRPDRFEELYPKTNEFDKHERSFHAGCSLPYGRGLDFAFGGAAVGSLTAERSQDRGGRRKADHAGTERSHDA